MRIIYLTYGQSGSIRSPNYPSNYGRLEDCKWRIMAPYNQKVLLYFTSIDLEDCCSCDYVKILDGSYSYSNLLTKGCGSILPPPVTSSGRYLYMTFRSDNSGQRQGFVAHYRALNSSSGESRALRFFTCKKEHKVPLNSSMSSWITLLRKGQRSSRYRRERLLRIIAVESH